MQIIHYKNKNKVLGSLSLLSRWQSVRKRLSDIGNMPIIIKDSYFVKSFPLKIWIAAEETAIQQTLSYVCCF